LDNRCFLGYIYIYILVMVAPFDFIYMTFHENGWLSPFSSSNIYPRLVREFYKNLKISSHSIAVSGFRDQGSRDTHQDWPWAHQLGHWHTTISCFCVTPRLLQKWNEYVSENFDFYMTLRFHQSYKLATECIFI